MLDGVGHKGDEHAMNCYYSHADKLIEEMRQDPPEEIEINGVRLYTKARLEKRLRNEIEYVEANEKRARFRLGLWCALNTAAIVTIAAVLLIKK